MRNPIPAAVACLAAVLLPPTGTAHATDEPAAALEGLLQRYHELGQFNGSALVARKGVVVLNRGYGFANREWEVPNSGSTRHRIGSITKSFTAALILQQASEGKLDLDKTVRDYFPDYPAHAGATITLRQLLVHTDGLPNYTWASEFWRSRPAIPRLQRALPANRRRGRPGRAAQQRGGDHPRGDG